MSSSSTLTHGKGRGRHVALVTDGHLVGADPHLPIPPTDDEQYLYLRGRQKRGLFVFQFLAFLGVAVSFGGFATGSYWTMIFCVPLVVLVVEQLLGFYTSTFRRMVTLEDHRATVELYAPTRWPSVDVYLPTCGERLEVLDNTMRYVADLVWSGAVEVHVLDDADRVEVRALADRYGYHYLARPGSEFKKAGNLNHALERTDGDFIVILDADFVPRPDFLTELMPYFEVPAVGIVQSPQYFGTTRNQNWVERTAGATQELFYRFIQPSRDHHNAAICTGTSAVYRRAALDSIGGFPRVGHSEDIYTGMDMTKQGYRTQYVPSIVSSGLSPDNLDSFISQQYRWCEGSVALLFSRSFHLDQHLTLQARLSYWSGFLYYIGTAMYGFIAPLPAVIMAMFFPLWVRPMEILWLSGVAVLWLLVYPIMMKSRWRIEVLRLQTVYGFAHAFNIAHIISRTVMGWHVTGSAARPPISRSVRRLYTWYLGLGQVALIGALALRTWQYGFGRFWGMEVFSLLNLYIFVPLVWSEMRALHIRRRDDDLGVVPGADTAAADTGARV